MPMKRFPALAQPEFRRYFIGQSIALVGGFAYNVALSWLAYRLTGSTLVLGIVGFATLAPAMVISPVAGLFADRYPRRNLLLILLSGVALQGVAMAVLTATGTIDTTLLIGFALLRGILFSCEIPIRHAFLAELVPDREMLPNAVALHSSALNSARFIGPAIGGALIVTIGEAACFLLHSVVLIAPLYQIWRIRVPGRIRTAVGQSFARQYVDGWRYAFSDPPIARMLAAVFVLGFAIGPYTFLMPAVVSELYGARPDLVGLFLSCAGLGAATAAFSLAARRRTHRLDSIALGGNVGAGLGLLAFSLSGWLPLSIAGMALVGFGTIAQAASTNMAIQKSVDDDRRSRVMAIYTAMFLGATPIGSLAFGKLGHWIGAANGLTVGAALALIGAAASATALSTAARANAGDPR
jgi:MFS family permease